jgi:hypothetical protein
MTMISAISNRRCDMVVDALRAEFGAVLAGRIMEAEAADFLWDARVMERYLGQHLDVGLGYEDEEMELARIAILSFLGGRWHVAACLVDSEGLVVDLLWKEKFDGLDEAEAAFDRAA